MLPCLTFPHRLIKTIITINTKSCLLLSRPELHRSLLSGRPDLLQMVNVVRETSDPCPVVMIVDSGDHQLTGSVSPRRGAETTACLRAAAVDVEERVDVE